MRDMNHIGTVVKILEIPKHKILKGNIPFTEFRAQIPTFRGNKIVNLTFWGKLAIDIIDCYHVNDYILIEGYFSAISKKPLKKVKITITVLRTFAFILNESR